MFYDKISEWHDYETPFSFFLSEAIVILQIQNNICNTFQVILLFILLKHSIFYKTVTLIMY